MMVVASDGVILYASDNIETFVALNPRDVIGHSLHDLVQSDQDRDTISSNLKPKGIETHNIRTLFLLYFHYKPTAYVTYKNMLETFNSTFETECLFF